MTDKKGKSIPHKTSHRRVVCNNQRVHGPPKGKVQGIKNARAAPLAGPKFFFIMEFSMRSMRTEAYWPNQKFVRMCLLSVVRGG